MGFPAAEIRLQLDHRVPVQPVQSPGDRDQQKAHPLGNIGPRKELLGVLIFGCRFAAVYRRNIGGEIGLFVKEGNANFTNLSVKGYSLK